MSDGGDNKSGHSMNSEPITLSRDSVEVQVEREGWSIEMYKDLSGVKITYII